MSDDALNPAAERPSWIENYAEAVIHLAVRLGPQASPFQVTGETQS
ncbi:hypothetical protein [Roseococcus sp.]